MKLKTPTMESIPNHPESNSEDEPLNAIEAKSEYQISYEEISVPNENVDTNSPENHVNSTTDAIDLAVKSHQSPADSPSDFPNLVVNTTKAIEKDQNISSNELYHSNDLLMVGPTSAVNNAFENDNNESSEGNGKCEQLSENTPSFKLGFNNNAYKDENMCIENIEDENVGRMVYNNREPLSMIMEGNSPVTETAPVAEVAPIIVVNHKYENDNSESSKSDDVKKNQSSTKQKSNRTSLKSEIILPSKSKIPQGIRGIKAMPGSNRLYLTGLKKSSSLNSPLSTADFSPRSQTFSERNESCTEQYNNISEMSGASTPMSNLIDAADIRSKSNLFLFLFAKLHS